MPSLKEEEPQDSNEDNPQTEIYKMMARQLTLTAQCLEKVILNLPEGIDLPEGIELQGNSGFSFTSTVEPIAFGGPVEITFCSTPAVRDFTRQFGLDTRYRLDVGLHTDTDDEGSYRRLRERIDAGEEIGDTTFLLDPIKPLKLSFLPNGEIGAREIVVPFEDGAYVPSRMTPGSIELAGSILNSLLARVTAISASSS